MGSGRRRKAPHRCPDHRLRRRGPRRRQVLPVSREVTGNHEQGAQQLRCGAGRAASHSCGTHRILAHRGTRPPIHPHSPFTTSWRESAALVGRRAMSGNVVIFDMSRDNKHPPEGLPVSLFPFRCATRRGLGRPRRGGGEQSKALIPSVTFSSTHAECSPLSPCGLESRRGGGRPRLLASRLVARKIGDLSVLARRP